MQRYRRILAATSNKNKILELRAVAAEFGVEIVAPFDVAKEKNLAPISEIAEDANTYEGNALIKARAYFDWAKMPTLADDSGLELVCLDNRPGIYSARYAGRSSSYAEKMRTLVAEVHALEKVHGRLLDRTAYFSCSLVLCLSQNEHYSSSAFLKGKILDHPRGQGGFGYDPIILIDKFQKTLAEVDFSLTAKEGFRAEAMRKLLESLSE